MGSTSTNNESEIYNTKEYDVVVGIDFGSSGMGFAYSFNDLNNIILGKLFKASDSKIPTEIILDDNNNILAYGEECKIFIKTNGINSGHYYKNIKMNLYHKKTEIKAEYTEKKVNIKLLISKILILLKKEVLKSIKEIRPNIAKDKIKWIITVPAIWDFFAKNIMIEAAKKAGLIDIGSDLSCFLSLEPEAASLYCLNDNSFENNFMKEGKEYIVCDLGGGTGDIVAHIVGTNRHISEIYFPLGGNYGSEEIDKYIIEKIIQGLFCVRNFSDLCKLTEEKNKENNENITPNELIQDWIDLQSQIEEFKKSIKKGKIETDYPLRLTVFKDLFSENDFERRVNRFNMNNKKEYQITIQSKKKMIIGLPYAFIYDFIKGQSFLISEQINKILKEKKHITSLIFVGGYSQCDIMTDLITNTLQRIQTFKPSNPALAILKGAVIFGIQPFIIQSRKAQFTIGVASNFRYDENIYGEIKAKKNKNYDWLYEGSFYTFIKINEEIPYGKVIYKKFWMLGGNAVILSFYRSLKENPLLVDEEGVEEIGKYELKLEKNYPREINQRECLLSINFGGTFMDIKVVHIVSGKELEARLIIK